jgi:Tfp pilus assembly protein PilO
MEATARTYRYLDPAEVDAQKRAKADAAKANKPEEGSQVMSRPP